MEFYNLCTRHIATQLKLVCQIVDSDQSLVFKDMPEIFFWFFFFKKTYKLEKQDYILSHTIIQLIWFWDHWGWSFPLLHVFTLWQLGEAPAVPKDPELRYKWEQESND